MSYKLNAFHAIAVVWLLMLAGCDAKTDWVRVLMYVTAAVVFICHTYIGFSKTLLQNESVNGRRFVFGMAVVAVLAMAYFNKKSSKSS
jgi:hypothetical protein